MGQTERCFRCGCDTFAWEFVHWDLVADDRSETLVGVCDRCLTTDERHSAEREARAVRADLGWDDDEELSWRDELIDPESDDAWVLTEITPKRMRESQFGDGLATAA